MGLLLTHQVVGIINPSGFDPDNRPNLVMKLLKLGSPIKWAIEALVTAEFRGMVFGDKDRGRCVFLNGLVTIVFTHFSTKY